MARWELTATILEHRRASPGQFELMLHAPPIAEAALPGQFVQLRAMDSLSPYLRRSYSILRANPDKGLISVFYSVQSAFTELLSMKPVGSSVRVLGPLGNWFQPVREAKRHILAAGGFGAPPLCYFASKLAPTLGKDDELVILIAARSRDLLVGLDEFRALGATALVATDDGSSGYRGQVTDLLRENLTTGSAVYACGPNGMLRSIARECISQSMPCQVSIESPMPCGLGVCLACAVKTPLPDGGTWYKRACADGPIFQANEIVWD